MIGIPCLGTGSGISCGLASMQGIAVAPSHTSTD
jgi:hypothetical protein